MLNKISHQKTTSFMLLSALSILSISICAHESTNETLWHNLMEDMLKYDDAAPSVSFHELPAWIPFESFNFFNMIFLNSNIKHLSTAQQRAIIGHELSHVIAGHSSKQIALFLAGSLALACSFKKILKTELLSPLHAYTKTALACITAYACYYLFNAYVVYEDELAAERFNALSLGNYNAVIQRLFTSLINESYNTACSWSDTVFKLIAPRFPSAREFLYHIIA